MENKIIKMNIRVSEKVKDYLESEYKRTGIPQSAQIVMILERHIDEKQALTFSKEIDGLLKKIEEYKNDLQSEK